MALSPKLGKEISEHLKKVIRKKIKEYKPETDHKPFHHRLFGRDRYATFSFIHSMNTSFGMSVWEQVSSILSRSAGNDARKVKLLGEIDEDTDKLIHDIMFRLRKAEIDTNKEAETEQIRQSIKAGKLEKYPDSTVDLMVKKKDGREYYFDITSAKPNIKEFAAMKLKLLRWVALRLSQDRDVKIYTALAIPYNPEHPEPYDRWTLRGLFDLKAGEILVAEKFWNFVACENIYDNLLDLFQKIGAELKPEMDAKIAEFK